MLSRLSIPYACCAGRRFRRRMHNQIPLETIQEEAMVHSTLRKVFLFLSTAACAAVVCVTFCGSAKAQLDHNQRATPLQFEVASVRPSVPSPQGGAERTGGWGAACLTRFRIDGDRVDIRAHLGGRRSL